MIEGFLAQAKPPAMEGEIFALISPHAGYGYSGQVAAFGYKLIEGKPYKTVIILAPSHQYAFSGVSVYAEGTFRTPLGEVMVDRDFTQKLLKKIHDVSFIPEAFAKEHALEVQIPFLQKVLPYFKIVPIIMGDSSFETCQRLAILLKNAVGGRKDVLVVASTDLYHGYDFEQAFAFDKQTVSFVEKMDAEGLFKGLENGQLQMCGGYGVVTTLILSKLLGHEKTKVLCYTNSAEVTGKKEKGVWTVGYVSCAIDNDGGSKTMLDKTQRKKLLEIARKAIEVYLRTGKKMEVTETDPVFNKEMGAFVTLHKSGELRGCIGNIIGRGPLYLTIRDMAIEAATGDPRFPQVNADELKNIEIEISVLTPLEKIDDVSKIEMGVHGVLVRKGYNSGVFLPQVATETGWSREEFMDNLCAHKAGLAADAWKDKTTDIYIFSAEVFSEKEVLSGD
jgi:AmmeMemoRadiSam system protein B/AmmeMemoRadiSam system protein A